MAEKQDVEWKESWRDEYLKWICGFANAKGGKIYIGTDDNGKSVMMRSIQNLSCSAGAARRRFRLRCIISFPRFMARCF